MSFRFSLGIALNTSVIIVVVHQSGL